MTDPLTYNELPPLMQLVDRENVKARQMADFSVTHAPDDLDYWNDEIAKNNVLYQHLKDLATEQLQVVKSASSPVRV